MATLVLPARTRRPASSADLGEMPYPRPVAANAPEVERLTLDDRVSDLWRGLAASTAVSCPLCAAEMEPRWSAGAGVVGGRCGGCGTTLE